MLRRRVKQGRGMESLGGMQILKQEEGPGSKYLRTDLKGSRMEQGSYLEEERPCRGRSRCKVPKDCSWQCEEEKRASVAGVA